MLLFMRKLKVFDRCFYNYTDEWCRLKIIPLKKHIVLCNSPFRDPCDSLYQSNKNTNINQIQIQIAIQYKYKYCQIHIVLRNSPIHDLGDALYQSGQDIAWYQKYWKISTNNEKYWKLLNEEYWKYTLSNSQSRWCTLSIRTIVRNSSKFSAMPEWQHSFNHWLSPLPLRPTCTLYNGIPGPEPVWVQGNIMGLCICLLDWCKAAGWS